MGMMERLNARIKGFSDKLVAKYPTVAKVLLYASFTCLIVLFIEVNVATLQKVPTMIEASGCVKSIEIGSGRFYDITIQLTNDSIYVKHTTVRSWLVNTQHMPKIGEQVRLYHLPNSNIYYGLKNNKVSTSSMRLYAELYQDTVLLNSFNLFSFIISFWVFGYLSTIDKIAGAYNNKMIYTFLFFFLNFMMTMFF